MVFGLVLKPENVFSCCSLNLSWFKFSKVIYPNLLWAFSIGNEDDSFNYI